MIDQQPYLQGYLAVAFASRVQLNARRQSEMRTRLAVGAYVN